MSLTIGADPELFLSNAAGKFISSIGKFGGTKAAPQPLSIAKGCAVQEDNVALEFNIPPAKTEDDFVGSITAALDELRQLAFMQDLSLAIKASAVFDADQLDNPVAKMFGCTPDYNAWTGKRNPQPKGTRTQLRSCGGHIHFGYPADSVAIRDLVRACDLFIGAPLTQLDGDNQRRSLYGRAGAYRPCTYGMEYRTPSNYWLTDESLVRFVYQSAHRAYNYCLSGLPSLEAERELILAAIDEENFEAFTELDKRYGIRFYD